MASAADITGDMFKNFSATVMARVLKSDGTYLKQADCSSIVYTISLIDQTAIDTQTPVTGHIAVPVTIATSVYDTLQTTHNNALWTVDDTGFNFVHSINVSTNQAFTAGESYYRIAYTITPAAGQPIPIRCKVKAI